MTVSTDLPNLSEENFHNKTEDNKYSLKGRMGTIDLLFTVLAFTAPLGVVFGFLSFNISFGIGVPISFLGVTGLMILFAIGFTNMSRHVARPGAFYTYISEGLGRPLGLGASFLALSTYGFNITAAIVFAGIAVNNLIESFSGYSGISWWVWSLFMLAAVWGMSYFNVEFSAKVLSAILVIEVIAILIFDITLFADGGPEGHSLIPWEPESLMMPSIGLLLLFSVGLFNGFEATAIYRDEVKEPSKTIPRATYLAIIFLGFFYAISSYALILSTGVSNAVEAATLDPAGMMPKAILFYFGTFANQVVAVLLVTSLFASTLSLQNILSRYTHSLSVDGIFSSKLAAVHPKHGSPYRSALVVGAVLFAILMFLIFSNINENSLYGASAGIAFYGMLLLLCLTSISVIVYFQKNEKNISKWKSLYAPLIACVGITFVVLTATLNIDLLIDAPDIIVWSLLAAAYIFILLGVGIALYLKSTGSKLYDRIGRRLD